MEGKSGANDDGFGHFGRHIHPPVPLIAACNCLLRLLLLPGSWDHCPLVKAQRDMGPKFYRQ